MIVETLANLAQAAGGKIVAGNPQALVRGAFSDTRVSMPGGLFVALRGERFDGNVFAGDAVAKCGASAVLLDRPEFAAGLPANVGVIVVPDSREGFLGIARQHRQKLAGALWFGITGSVGKSSTKEMLAHILKESAGWHVHKAKASFNNSVGLSLTVAGATEDHEAVVLELGTNHPGEIKPLASVARPDIALITCAGESHLEAFGTVADVAREKAQILAYQSSQDVTILNVDDPHFSYWRAVSAGKVATFGRSERADVQGRHLRLNEQGCAEFMVRCGSALAECSLRVLGVHQMMNALSAIAAAQAAGIKLADAARALNSFEGVARRLALKDAHGITLIDDAYNANPVSFAAALETLNKMKAPRKFLVAGDMLELGAEAPRYHQDLGRLIAGSELTAVVTVGPLASLAGAAAVKARSSALDWVPCQTPEEAAAALKSALKPGDVVLLKGSHGVHLETCVELLTA